MVRTPVKHPCMHIGARSPGKAVKEIVHQLGLKIADQPLSYFCIDYGGRTPAEINCRQSQSFVHGHHEISRA